LASKDCPFLQVMPLWAGTYYIKVIFFERSFEEYALISALAITFLSNEKLH
jgi:hypothetical protein